jgi:tripartite ATP-independent transporter DctM subunit
MDVGLQMNEPVPLNGPSRYACAVELAITRTIEVLVSVLFAGECLVVFSGVVARYALHKPIVEVDEVSSLLFIWLAMLGAVLAFRHGEHMRMSALVDRLRPQTSVLLGVCSMSAALAFVVLILPAGFDAAMDERDIFMPVTGISNAWRAWALPAGAALMALLGIIQLIKQGSPRLTIVALLSMGALVTVIGLLKPVFVDLGQINLVIFFGVVLGTTVFSGVPLGFAFGLATVGYVSVATHAPVAVVASRMNEGMSHLILLSVPLFVFLGKLIEVTGLARYMIEFLAGLLGHVRGGLSYVLVGAMYLVSGISGSKAADMAAITPVLFPEMKKRGAKPGDLVALLSATGAQTETVPPSIVLITIGSVTSVSIAALFAGGLLPAIICGLTLCLMVGWRYRHEDLSGIARPSRKVVFKALIAALPALALPLVIRFAVVEGIATTTEVSTIAIVYSALVGLCIYRQFDWSRLKPMVLETASLSGAILLIVGAATAMGWGLTQSGFSRSVASVMTSLPGGAGTFMVASIAVFIVLGSILEGIPAIVLFGPLLFPVARQLGINDVHYSMVIILAMGIGLFSPPFGVGYYVACAIGRVEPKEGMRAIFGYMAALLLGLVIVAAFPWLSTAFL